MEILHRDDLTLGGFAGLKEHRLVIDPKITLSGEHPGVWPGLGNWVYLADARFNPGGETKMRQVVSGETITPELGMADTLILGMRLTEGVSLAAFREWFGVDPQERFAEELREPFEYRLVELADGNIRLTKRGRLLGNEVFARLLPD